MTSDLIDQHFRVEQKRGEPWKRLGSEGKWVAWRLRFPGFLWIDGKVHKQLGEKGWFATYADLEAAYQLWLKRQKEIAR